MFSHEVKRKTILDKKKSNNKHIIIKVLKNLSCKILSEAKAINSSEKLEESANNCMYASQKWAVKKGKTKEKFLQ